MNHTIQMTIVHEIDTVKADQQQSLKIIVVEIALRNYGDFKFTIAMKFVSQQNLTCSVIIGQYRTEK